MIIVVPALVLAFLVFYLPAIIATQEWLNYSSVSATFGDTVQVRYNTKYADNEPNLIAKQLIAAQGNSISSVAEDTWNPQSGETYTDFFNRISDELNSSPEKEMGAYWIDAE